MGRPIVFHTDVECAEEQEAEPDAQVLVDPNETPKERALRLLRRTGSSVERHLRSFTRVMLRRRLVLLLFYLHLLCLWMVEIWRQAQSRPHLSLDPAAQIDKGVALATRESHS